MLRKRIAMLVILTAALAVTTDAVAEKKKKNKNEKKDPYAEFVWPPPPDDPRIRLVDVIGGRADLEAKGGFKKTFLGSTYSKQYDTLARPFDVEYDPDGRVLVSDSDLAAILRFDLEAKKMDVLGTTTAMALTKPLGFGVADDGSIYVADVGAKKVLAFDAEGTFIAAYGKMGELESPTDAAVSPDGTRVYVCDAKAYRVVVFDRETSDLLFSFGRAGEGEGEFNHPTSLAFDPDGQLWVVDQLNARLQVFNEDGEYIDSLGERGSGWGQFSRPKDVAIDRFGYVYAVDFAFGNVQLFDIDFELLTFIGASGQGPGRFFGASGVAVFGDSFAVVDQVGRRLQLFRYLEDRGGE